LRSVLAPFGQVEQEPLEEIRRALRRKGPGRIDQANDFIHRRRTVVGSPRGTCLDPAEKQPSFLPVEQSGAARGHVAMVPGAPLVHVKADVRTGKAGPKSRGLHDMPHLVVHQLDGPAADELQRLVTVEEFIDPGGAARHPRRVQEGHVESHG
jgi:hypothetical protein